MDNRDIIVHNIQVKVLIIGKEDRGGNSVGMYA